MEKKLLLIVKENIVVYVRRFDVAWIEKTTDTFPYRSNDTPGNPYARALRLRDHNVKRGTPVSILILDDGDPRDYYYKVYNPSTQSFSMGGETEEERQSRIDTIDTFFGIEQEDYEAIEYMKPDYSVYKDYISEEAYDSLRTKVRTHNLFSDEEYNAIEEALPQMPADKRVRAIYTIASNHSRVCIDPIVGTTPVDRDQEWIQEKRGIALKWWFKLAGTQHEKKALMEIARLYSWSKDEDKAVDIYKDILKRGDVSASEKDTIRKRIDVLGTGRSIFNEAQALYDDGDYKGCIKKLEKCVSKSTGIVKTFLKQPINELQGLCLIEEAKNADNDVKKKYFKEEALRLMYPERYLGDSKTIEWNRKKKKIKDNISDRDYFDITE